PASPPAAARNSATVPSAHAAASHPASRAPSLPIHAGRIATDVDVEARHPVTHLAQRQAQADAGRGAIEAMVLEGANEDVALDVVEVLRQVVRQRLLDRRHAGGMPGRLALVL